ncbi:MAG: hypothetical protein PHO33_04490, partial [Clostridia bacterium]|nr:hypothetical protein [Clostridia bacterium]
MNKLFKILIVTLILMPSVLFFSACGKDSNTVIKSNISGITFSNAVYDYDGSEKELFIAGTLLDGVSVEYTNNFGTNAGIYNATAILSGDGYNSLTLNATLTINRLN